MRSSTALQVFQRLSRRSDRCASAFWLVGQTIGSKLVQLGHDVRLGARSAANAKARDWKQQVGERASHGTFADAASFGEIVFNCTAGGASVEALQLAGEANLSGKVVIDVGTPLDFSRGMPPTLSICNMESLGERIQTTFPSTRVVKTLNTINCQVIVNPSLVPGDHDVFVCGNDAAAKSQVTTIRTSMLPMEGRDGRRAAARSAAEIGRTGGREDGRTGGRELKFVWANLQLELIPNKAGPSRCSGRHAVGAVPNTAYSDVWNLNV